MKYFRMSYDEAVHRRSWLNIIMLFSCIPSYKSESTPKEKGGKEMPKRLHFNQFITGDY